MRKKNTRLCCPYCGSDKLEVEAKVDPNTSVMVDWTEGGNFYCYMCCAHFREAFEIDVLTGLSINRDETPAKPPTFTPVSVDSDRVEAALTLLTQARDLLVLAGTPKSTERVRLAITSVRGALGNIQLRKMAIAGGRTRKRIRRAPIMRVFTTVRS